MGRGTLPKEKGPNGTTYVRLNDDRRISNDNSTYDRTGDLAEPDSFAYQLMQDQLDYLRRQLEVWQEEARRKDHIIAALTERIPELEPSREAPRESRESPVMASEERGSYEPSEEEKPAERRSWLYRFFFAP